MKLLRPFTGTGSVFFPIGRPPEGTCEFATDECLRHCYVNDTDGFDEETRITPDDKRRIYHRVINCSPERVRNQIIKDLDGLQTHILSWFGSGDCLMQDLEGI